MGVLVQNSHKEGRKPLRARWTVTSPVASDGTATSTVQLVRVVQRKTLWAMPVAEADGRAGWCCRCYAMCVPCGVAQWRAVSCRSGGLLWGGSGPPFPGWGVFLRTPLWQSGSGGCSCEGGWFSGLPAPRHWQWHSPLLSRAAGPGRRISVRRALVRSGLGLPSCALRGHGSVMSALAGVGGARGSEWQEGPLARLRRRVARRWHIVHHTVAPCITASWPGLQSCSPPRTGRPGELRCASSWHGDAEGYSRSRGGKVLEGWHGVTVVPPGRPA